MKINQIIKEKRKEQGLTLEQIASYLGVSTPAVHKWEKGVTYPDIVTLPALARLLKTDLNTLLSFKEDLSEIEIKHISTDIYTLMKEEGYEAGFQVAVKKIQEYPSCELLICALSVSLNSALSIFTVSDKRHYQKTLIQMVGRISKSENQELRNEAISLMITLYCDCGDYEKAEELIKGLPVSSPDQRSMLAKLYMSLGRYADAAELFEGKLFEASVDMQSFLLGMTQAALQEDRIEDAQYYADLYEKVTLDFEIMNCTSATAQLEVAVKQKDREKCLALLQNLLNATQCKWDIQHSRLYRHLRLSNAQVETFSFDLLPTIVEELKTSPELSFLHDSAEYKKLLADYKQRIKKIGKGI